MKKHTLILTFLFALACEGTPKENKSIAPSKEQQAKKEVITPKPKENGSINIKEQTLSNNKDNTKETEAGFLFVDISGIYSWGTTFALLDKEKDTLISFMDKKTYFENNVYETMDEDGRYKRKLKMVALDPEYGLFILKSFGLDDDGYYAVEVNKDTAYVHKEDHKDLLEFKSPEKYAYDGYYYFFYDTNAQLRAYPHEDSLELTTKDYRRHWYRPVKVKGDWFKLKDAKDCLVGDETRRAEKTVTGWLRWRKDGQIIVDFNPTRCH